jgi:hypothetical protein
MVGRVIYWIACGGAILILALALLFASEGDGRTAALLLGLAALIWFLGFALRRVMA